MKSLLPLRDALSDWLTAAFRRAIPEAPPGPPLPVVSAARPEFGDYQCNAAMSLARDVRRPPRELAEAIRSAAEPHPAVRSIEVAGPGFLNITLDDGALSGLVTQIASDPRLGTPEAGRGRTIVLDYSSPNVAKPMHIGHIRSTVIGNALDRMFRFLGYRVIADNHLGDWGTQFGLLLLGFRHFADPETYERSPIEELERVYVRSYERSKEDPAWLEAARAELVKLQQGDPVNRELWRSFVEHSLREFERIYQRLGVRFDLVRGESWYNDRLPEVIRRLEEHGLVRESEGALVVDLSDDGLPVCIVRKRDGAYNYATTDIATVLAREEEFHPDAVIYVTDERQQLHFRQIFAIARRLGVTTRLEHVWFGLMRLPEGTFSTRQGNVIKLERLLDEAEERALALVRENSPDMPPERQREVARAVGIGAVKYADLSQHPQSLVTFTWDKALAMDGNSAPYLQYACARMCSVLDKYAERHDAAALDAAPVVFTDPIERRLAVLLVRFSETVLDAAAAGRPNLLADHLFELAQTYSRFYQTLPFLRAPEGVRESRLKIGMAVARALRTGLGLLGIETPSRI